MRILLVGEVGQVAWELQRTLACLGEVFVCEKDSANLPIDLADGDSIRRVIRSVNPRLIVNAAAYTAVDRAEQETELAYQVNAVAPGVIAETARDINAGVVHYSTDYVYCGDAQRPYSETDPTIPAGIYGQTKLDGDSAVSAAGIPHLILRTSWVYGARGQNFLLTMLRLMKERNALSVVNDQIGAPTWSRMIAECTALIVAQCITDNRFDPGERSGVFHLTCAGQTSWYGFAEKIYELARARSLLPEKSFQLSPISSDKYPTAATRPAYSVLSNAKTWQVFNLRMPSWERALAMAADELAGASHPAD